MCYKSSRIRIYNKEMKNLRVLTKYLNLKFTVIIRATCTCAKRKRCYDVTLSRQEGSTTRHLASAQYWAGLAGGDTGRLFLMFGGLLRADRISYCPLDRMY